MRYVDQGLVVADLDCGLAPVRPFGGEDGLTTAAIDLGANAAVPVRYACNTQKSVFILVVRPGVDIPSHVLALDYMFGPLRPQDSLGCRRFDCQHFGLSDDFLS